MRILFSACPISGHITTILPLVLEARAAGHAVVVATGEEMAERLRRLGVEVWAAGPAAGLAGLGTAVQRSAFFARSAARRAEELIPQATQWGPDLVVSDTADVAGPVVAAVCGARHVVHGLGAMPPIGMWDAYAMHIDGLFARFGVRGSAESVRESLYLDVCPPALRRRGEAIWGRTLDLRPGLPVETTRMIEVGATAELDRLPFRDTVLVQPGTAADGRAVLAGLAGLPLNVVVRDDPRDYPAPAEGVIVATQVPIAAVLPRSRTVVSPGGPGISLPALAYGLPQLVLSMEPTAADPAAAEPTHAGAALTVRAVTPGEIERTVRDGVPRLLGDPSFAASAAWVQVEIAAMSPPEAVLRALTTEAIPALR